MERRAIPIGEVFIRFIKVVVEHGQSLLLFGRAATRRSRVVLLLSHRGIVLLNFIRASVGRKCATVQTWRAPSVRHRGKIIKIELPQLELLDRRRRRERQEGRERRQTARREFAAADDFRAGDVGVCARCPPAGFVVNVRRGRWVA